MDRLTGREAYRVVRDLLVRHRENYDAAVAAYLWPDVGGQFNWALDWFDSVAAGNPRTALRIIDEDRTDRSCTFAEMAQRSDRLATSLAAAGVARGDHVMVMLGNQVELWESMLAVMKLGEVIMPAASTLGPNDLADRFSRGAVRHVITNAEQVDKFTEIPGDFGRIAIGDAPASWLPYRLADTVVPPSRLATQTGADDPMLIYVTSGTTSRPKPVQHTHRSYQAPDRATADAIFAHARRNLAPYQRIRRIEFMELPKTISGKIRRVDLRGRRNTCESNDLTHEYRDR